MTTYDDYSGVSIRRPIKSPLGPKAPSHPYRYGDRVPLFDGVYIDAIAGAAAVVIDHQLVATFDRIYDRNGNNLVALLRRKGLSDVSQTPTSGEDQTPNIHPTPDDPLPSSVDPRGA